MTAVGDDGRTAQTGELLGGLATRAASQPVRAAFHGAHVVVRALLVAGRRGRRVRVVTGLRVRAAWHRSPLRCVVARDVRFGRRVQFAVSTKTSNVVEIGSGCLIGDDVRFELGGGELVLGPATDIRARCVIGVRGRFQTEGENVFQTGCVVHCDESIRIRWQVGIGEYSTIADSSHSHQGDYAWFAHNVRSAPVVIGTNTWLGSKVTIARGVRIGDRCVIGANSTVVKDVPDGYLASGVPAQVVRPVALPEPAEAPSSSS